MPRRSTDVALFVRFETREILNQAKSYGEIFRDNENRIVEEIKGAGQPVHDNVDYVTIQPLADKTTVIDRPVQCCDKALLLPGAKLHLNCRARQGLDGKPMLEECDIHRFYDEWQAYRSGQEEQTSGTPLKTWAGIDRATAADLAYHKVTTVEQLAEINDSNTAKFHALRQRARDYLKDAAKMASGVNFRAELDAKDKQLAAMQERLAALEARERPKQQKGA